MKKLFLIFVVVLSLFLLNLDFATACSCIEQSVSQQIAQSEFIFIGKVTKINRPIFTLDSSDPIKVTLDVSKGFKGSFGDSIAVLTTQDSASCGYSFEENGEYLVYATSENGNLNTNLCTGTKRLDEANEDLAELNLISPSDNNQENPKMVLSQVLVLGVLILIVAFLIIAEIHIVSWIKQRRNKKKR